MVSVISPFEITIKKNCHKYLQKLMILYFNRNVVFLSGFDFIMKQLLHCDHFSLIANEEYLRITVDAFQ